VTIKIFPLNGEGPEKVRFFIQRSAGDEESLLMLQHWLSLSLGETKDSGRQIDHRFIFDDHYQWRGFENLTPMTIL
jgi:hypothetical protein